MRARSLSFVFSALIAAFTFGGAFTACSSERGSGFDENADGALGGDGSINFGTTDSGEGGVGAAGGCSGDLHSLLDANGNVVFTCPPDQGCAAGKCVPACEAAAANKSSIGCDYYAYPPPFFSGSTSCLGAFVANTWGSPIKVTVSRNGTALNPESFGYLPTGSGSAITYAPLTGGVVPSGAVALLILNREGGACPAGTTSATGPVAVDETSDKAVKPPLETGFGHAFRIQTDAPSVAYDIFPYGGGATAVSSATLLIPTSAWGDNYVGTTAYPETISTAHPWLGILAAENGTEVTISPSVAITGTTTVPGTAKGTPVTYKLEAGQYVQLSQTADLTGSIIKANKPIGSWAGNRCTNVPKGPVACDGMHQQIPPVRALGSTYVAARYRNRKEGIEESPPWRIVGAVDGTQLTYDPPQADAPATISSGELKMFDAAGPFVVKSQDDNIPSSSRRT